MKEHGVQNEIRNALAGKCMLFRANVGTAWTGDVHKLPDGSLLIRNPRPFSTGLPKGFHDLFGIVTVEITPEMVGKTFARFISGDAKGAKGKQGDKQILFRNAVVRAGGVSDFWYSVEDALRTVQDAHKP